MSGDNRAMEEVHPEVLALPSIQVVDDEGEVVIVAQDSMAWQVSEESNG